MSPPVLVRRYRARAEEIGRIGHDVRAYAPGDLEVVEARAGGGTPICMAFATG